MLHKYCLPVLILLLILPGADAQMAGGGDGHGESFMAVSPLIGWNRDELKVRGPGGMMTTETDTALEYGLFAIAGTPHFTVNNFLFFTDVNNTDILGNFTFANYYVDKSKPFTLNLGAGYLYHRIAPADTKIEVHVPMVKVGPLVRVDALNLSLNPYVGYAWEQVETPFGDNDNDSYLYGLSLKWHWRMIQTSLKYYFQDSQDIEEDFHTFRGRVTVGINEHWGVAARVDYMEHQTTDDTSFLMGPAYNF